MSMEKSLARQKRHWRIRKKIVGTTDKPRMNVYRSSRHLYAQLIDDISGRSLVSCSTLSKKFKETVKQYKNDTKSAKELGKIVAEMAKSKKIKKVIFDRGGYKYHGKVKSLADGAREAGLKF